MLKFLDEIKTPWQPVEGNKYFSVKQVKVQK